MLNIFNKLSRTPVVISEFATLNASLQDSANVGSLKGTNVGVIGSDPTIRFLSERCGHGLNLRDCEQQMTTRRKSQALARRHTFHVSYSI